MVGLFVNCRLSLETGEFKVGCESDRAVTPRADGVRLLFALLMGNEKHPARVAPALARRKFGSFAGVSPCILTFFDFES